MGLEARLRDRFVLAHPAEAARLLEPLPTPELAQALLDLPTNAWSELLRWLAPYSTANALASVPAEQVARLLEAARSDAAAAILRAMDARARAAVQSCLSAAADKALRPLLRYAEGTAGALMDPSVLSVAENVSVAEAMELLARSPQPALYYLYVVAEDQKLVGVLNLRELMTARPEQQVGMIAVRPVETLPARATSESIVAHRGWKTFHALPVVDSAGRFLGAVRYETLRKLEEHLSDAALDDGSAETAAALAELYGLGLKGLFEWAASAVLCGSQTSRRKP